MGSPPPQGSKKVVLKFRSRNNIVIAPASTGRLRSNRKAVKNTDQTKRGISSATRPDPRMFIMVAIKLIAPRMEDTPAKCSERMAKSTEEPGWPKLDSGG